MRTHKDFADLAQMCWRHSHLAQTEGVARELRRMALEYQQAAAKLDSGNLPPIGNPEIDNEPIV